jgi:hypothetical protein
VVLKRLKSLGKVLAIPIPALLMLKSLGSALAMLMLAWGA